MSKINLVALKPSSFEVVCFSATIAGTTYQISNKSLICSSHRHVLMGGGGGWEQHFSPHAVYIYIQIYNPKISGSRKVIKQEAEKIQNCTAHKALPSSPVSELFGLREAESGSWASCHFPPSLSIFIRTNRMESENIPLLNKLFLPACSLSEKPYSRTFLFWIGQNGDSLPVWELS